MLQRIAHGWFETVCMIESQRVDWCRDLKPVVESNLHIQLLVVLWIENVEKKLLCPLTELFFPFPTFGTHKISGESFELMDGIMGMSLSPKRINRSLYFHALASETENIVSLNVLGNRTAFETDANANPASFQVLGPRGSQSAASAMDANGNLYFGMNAINAIACWDTTKVPLTRATVRTLVKDDVKLQFASGMKVIRNTDGEEELWVVTNRFQVRIVSGSTRLLHENFSPYFLKNSISLRCLNFSASNQRKFQLKFHARVPAAIKQKNLYNNFFLAFSLFTHRKFWRGQWTQTKWISVFRLKGLQSFWRQGNVPNYAMLIRNAWCLDCSWTNLKFNFWKIWFLEIENWENCKTNIYRVQRGQTEIQLLYQFL